MQRWLSCDVLAYDSDKYWLLRVYEQMRMQRLFSRIIFQPPAMCGSRTFGVQVDRILVIFFFLLGLILSLTHELMSCLACPYGGDGCLQLRLAPVALLLDKDHGTGLPSPLCFLTSIVGWD